MAGGGPGWGWFGVAWWRGPGGAWQPPRRRQEGPRHHHHQQRHEPGRQWRGPPEAGHAPQPDGRGVPELMEHVLTFLAGGEWLARRELGRVALVCRLWREAATGEEVWGRVASELMPAMGRRVSEVGARRCVLERGHCHRDRRAWVGNNWWYSLRLQVEVWDTLDNFVLFSAEGLLGLSVHPHEMSIDGADRREVVGPAFSAASRDPVQRRFASIDDYFRRGQDTVDEPFIIRVYVKDEWTGRQALLWDSGTESRLEASPVEFDADHSFRAFLPEGSRKVKCADSLPMYSTSLPGQAVRAKATFFLHPEAGQEGVEEADKLWRVAGGDKDNYGDHLVLCHGVRSRRD
jgi:hypothetical protein